MRPPAIPTPKLQRPSHPSHPTLPLPPRPSYLAMNPRLNWKKASSGSALSTLTIERCADIASEQISIKWTQAYWTTSSRRRIVYAIQMTRCVWNLKQMLMNVLGISKSQSAQRNVSRQQMVLRNRMQCFGLEISLSQFRRNCWQKRPNSACSRFLSQPISQHAVSSSG